MVDLFYSSNILDTTKLAPTEILKIYKEQQSTERGFRFIKDPLFFADSLFVKNPERVETMMMLMALCLLVYNLGQRQLRIALKTQKFHWISYLRAGYRGSLINESHSFAFGGCRDSKNVVS